MIDTYAQISSGTIINILLATSSDFFNPAYTWVDITSYSPKPQIGWTTSDNVTFAPPGLPNDAYGNTVVYTTDGTYDYYTVAGITQYKFPTGTAQSVVYLTIAIQDNLILFMNNMQNFIQSQISIQSQLQFVCMYLAAQEAGLTNRVAYIAQLLTWLNGVESYAATYVTSVRAMTNISTITSTVFNPSSISALPSVTLMGAIEINS